VGPDGALGDGPGRRQCRARPRRDGRRRRRPARRAV
ncbi:MAG: hypothetical protein AVDCRST_MAG06-222, partial [uncultured Nocardioides sp.]